MIALQIPKQTTCNGFFFSTITFYGWLHVLHFVQVEVNIVGLLLYSDHKYSSNASQCGVTCGTLSLDERNFTVHHNTMEPVLLKSVSFVWNDYVSWL